MVIDFIKRLSACTEISLLRLVGWIELSRSKYYQWRDRYGKANEHNVLIPRDHWLEQWEKDFWSRAAKAGKEAIFGAQYACFIRRVKIRYPSLTRQPVRHPGW